MIYEHISCVPYMSVVLGNEKAMNEPISIIISPIINTLIQQLLLLIKSSEEFPSYSSSSLKDELEKLSSSLTPIQAELIDEEEMQSTDPVLRYWLGELQDVASDAQDVLGTFSSNIYWWSRRKQQQVCASKTSSFQHDAALKIKHILARLDRIAEAKQKVKFGSCVGRPKLPHPPVAALSVVATGYDVCGREKDKNEIVAEMLLSSDDRGEGEGERNNFSVIPIIGMGGLGKTTLAQLVYKDDRVIQHFELRVWVCVSVHFNLTRILQDIINSHNSHMNHDHLGPSTNLDPAGCLSVTSLLESHVVHLLANKRVLIVLDDVWTDNYLEWEPLEKLFNQGGRGSRILVTSRTSKVPAMMGAKHPFHLGLLPDDECWRLLHRIAFPPSKPSTTTVAAHKDLELENIGQQIAAKCRGLPLAVKAMGGLLRANIDVSRWRKILANDICKAEKHNILPALKLSYDHLPSHLKQCFSYCSLFPKGHVFDKKELVKLWIAEDFIQSSASGKVERVEEIAGQYFDELLMRSFFRPLELDRERYSMHDLFHELAQLVSGTQCCQAGTDVIKQCPISQKTRHLSLLCKDVKQPVFEILNKTKKLRTLLFPSSCLKDFGNATGVLDRMLRGMTYIRVLDLSSSNISELPESIERLELLRYLDLSKTEITQLPDSVCSLLNLQTLRLLGCLSLSSLPMYLGNLINLRHLELDERFWYKHAKVPPRIGNLTSLHSLHSFPVGSEDGYGIEELKNMAYLADTLSISKLENAVDAGEAKLKEKENLHRLVLEWSLNGYVEQQDAAVQEKVLKDLQPHSSLKELQICHYAGARFPLWMRDGQLQNLQTLTLNQCLKCQILSLGGLPHLRRLKIKGMKELQEWKQQEEYASLTSLKISNCPRLKRWPSHFPKLKELKIQYCDSLMALAISQSLEVLILIENLVLEDWNEVNCSLSNLLELKVFRCPKLKALPQNFQPQRLEISGCESLRALPPPEKSQRLQHLTLDKCEDGTLVGQISETSSLYSLVISSISKATSFPKWPHLPGLRALHIRHCKDLVSLSQEASPFKGWTSLKLLSIQGCSKLLSLPVEGLPTALECLTLGSCRSLESLGPNDVLRSLTSLKDLYIEDCPKIKSFPKEGVSLSLQHVVIHGCPILMERCRMEDGGGEDWPKIKHISDLEICSSEAYSTHDLSETIQTPTSPSGAKSSIPSSGAWYHRLACCKGPDVKEM